ncbi:hypothetical protein CDAR_279301 [Caerostris darwini]|uniref:Uncharacterized protein n=1 Tax=Caerostris darwini TaxID=1538125 RepID=A0AAV4VM57_9ARAC|nr:hypothetical protein CDAR_279301 [Caerostris darwini]
MVEEASLEVGSQAYALSKSTRKSTFVQQRVMMFFQKGITLTVWRITPIRRSFVFGDYGSNKKYEDYSKNQRVATEIMDMIQTIKEAIVATEIMDMIRKIREATAATKNMKITQGIKEIIVTTEIMCMIRKIKEAMVAIATISIFR